MSDYYDYAPQLELRHPIVVTGYLSDFTRSVTYRAASLLGLTYHDIDRLVEHEAGMEIGRLVREEGEPAYRAIESQILVSVLGQEPSGLIALGDGGLLRSHNREHVEEQGRLVVLELELANLFWRVQKLAHRLEPASWHPLFAGVPEDLTAIRPFYQQRKAVFDTAPTRIDANALNASQACQALMDCITTPNR